MTVADPNLVESSREESGRSRAAVEWAALFVAAVVIGLVGEILPSGPARAVVVTPVVVIFPGFVLLSVLLGRTRPRDPALLGVFSFALSLGLLVLDALVLNAAGIRLSASSLALTLLLATGIVIAAAISFGRRLESPLETSFTPSATLRPGLITRGIAFVAAVALVVGMVSLVATHLPMPTAPAFDSISLGATWATRGSALHVHTGQTVNIPIVVETDGTPGGIHELTTSVDGAVTSQREIYIGSRATWKGQVVITTPPGHSLHRVDVSLGAETSSGTSQQVVVYLDNDAG